MHEGVLNIDKPSGMTSHDVVSRIRRVSQMRRVGHAGTLDPLATGVLLLCVGRATRLLEYVTGQRKVYEAVVRLGQATDTYDADGDIVAERPFAHITPAQINAALVPFRGTIQQRPPIYSAIKKDGKRSYELARQGIAVDIPLREVTIYELTWLKWTAPDMTIRVASSAGTYIRSIAHDLGEALGCGGHLTALRRIAIGDFSETTAVSLNDLTTDNWLDWLQPADVAVAHLPQLILNPEEAQAISQGKRVDSQPGQPEAALVRAYNQDTGFIGMVVRNDQQWQAKKILYPTP